jgi:Flp pilus assembly protein CpaB
VTKSRLRNFALPVALAGLAAILIGIYIVSYRNSVTHGAGLVKVLVAARDIPAGTDGSAIAGGGYLESQSVPRRTVVPGSVTSAAPLTSLVAKGQIYQGEQVSLRQFAPAAQGGIFASFSGDQRIVVVPGDPNQMLAGTISDGDRIDVVATAKYHFNDVARAMTRVVLRNLLVLNATDAPKSGTVGATPTTTTTLVMTDSQAQTMGWALKNSNWFFVLRPTKQPRNNTQIGETLLTFLSRGLPPATAERQIGGSFSGGIDAP